MLMYSVIRSQLEEQLELRKLGLMLQMKLQKEYIKIVLVGNVHYTPNIPKDAILSRHNP